MKTIILLCTLLYITICTAQSHKDSLLLADAVPVRDTLDMIFYLESRASNYLIMTKEEQRASNVNFSGFYEDEIKGANTVYTIDIDNFLKTAQLGNFENYDTFVDRVYKRINEITISLINKYGFPSAKRMPPGFKPAADNLVYVINFRGEYRKEFKRLFKSEYELGNIDEKDYNLVRFFIRWNRIMIERDMKWLDKNTNATFHRAPRYIRVVN